jgi:hypothetical protein
MPLITGKCVKFDSKIHDCADMIRNLIKNLKYSGIQKIFCLYFLSGCVAITVTAQSKKDMPEMKGKNNSISFGVNIPFGDFSSTHRFGAGADYSWSKYRYGLLKSIPIKSIGFTFNAGSDYFFGKKETIGLYKYDYPNYLYLHTYGGIIYNLVKKINISFTAGPALSFYSGNAQFNIGINLSGNYYFNKNMAISPAILFMKESISEPLWVASLKASIAF